MADYPYPMASAGSVSGTGFVTGYNFGFSNAVASGTLAPGYTVVTLTSGTSWTPPASVSSIAIFLIGGGGGGGGGSGGVGGGGSGSLPTYSGNYSVTGGTPISYAVGGGGGGGSGTARGSAGTNTTFGTLTSYGGVSGGGSATGVVNGVAGNAGGGSGGGGGAYSGGTGAGGGITKLGSSGGAAQYAAAVAGGGGGGSLNATGGAGNSTTGTGGAGQSGEYFNGILYGSGGGGGGTATLGAGGSATAGNGASLSAAATAATGTYGDGGGGGNATNPGGSSGSQGSIVLAYNTVRYADDYMNLSNAACVAGVSPTAATMAAGSVGVFASVGSQWSIVTGGGETTTLTYGATQKSLVTPIWCAGTVYNGSSPSQGLIYAATGAGTMVAEHSMKVAGSNVITMAGWFNCGVTSNGSTFDLSACSSLTNSYNQYLQFQVTASSTFQIHLENQSVSYSSWITGLAANTWYWICWNCNFTAGTMALTVYNANGSVAGSTTNTCNTDTGVKFWYVGNGEARTASSNNLYFENWYADYTFGNYPLGP